MAKYIGAIDQGTTSTRFIVFDRSGGVVSISQKEHQQIFPQPGWVEHDAQEIWVRTREVVAEAMNQAGLTAGDLAAIGITNQRRNHGGLESQNRQARRERAGVAGYTGC